VKRSANKKKKEKLQTQMATVANWLLVREQKERMAIGMWQAMGIF
jgi:hypothetical protein